MGSIQQFMSGAIPKVLYATVDSDIGPNPNLQQSQRVPPLASSRKCGQALGDLKRQRSTKRGWHYQILLLYVMIRR